MVDSVASTNDEVRRLAAGGAAPLTAVIADHQRAGRGRLSRSWHSAPGLGLYISVLFRPGRPAAESTRWTLAASVAACRAAREVSGREVGIKWPNDLIYAKRKLGGTLTELRSSGDERDELIVGTGVNVHHRAADFPPELADRATSLAMISGRDDLDGGRLAALYLRRLEELATRLAADLWEPVAAEWTGLAVGAVGARVRVSPGPGGEDYDALSRGLDPVGGLVVERPDGRRVTLHAADSIVLLEA